MNEKIKLSTDQYHVLNNADDGEKMFVATSQYTTNTLREGISIGAWATPSALRGLHKRGLIVADLYWRGANVTITEKGKVLIAKYNKQQEEEYNKQQEEEQHPKRVIVVGEEAIDRLNQTPDEQYKKNYEDLIRTLSDEDAEGEDIAFDISYRIQDASDWDDQFLKGYLCALSDANGYDHYEYVKFKTS